MNPLSFPVSDIQIQTLIHTVEHCEGRLELCIVLAHILDRVVSWDNGVAFDVIDIERRLRVENDLYRFSDFVSRLALECNRQAERLEERLPVVDVLFTNGEEQRVVFQITTNLVPTSCPHVDCVDPSEAERSLAKLRIMYASSIDWGLTLALAVTNSHAAVRTRLSTTERPS